MLATEFPPRELFCEPKEREAKSFATWSSDMLSASMFFLTCEGREMGGRGKEGERERRKERGRRREKGRREGGGEKEGRRKGQMGEKMKGG